MISLMCSVLSAAFFLSITALICFTLDHLLCPASDVRVVTNVRRHCWQTEWLMAALAVLQSMPREVRGTLHLAITAAMME